MTSKLTRERLEKIKSWRETYGAGSNVMLPAEEAEELACLALAAIDSKPFAYIIQDKYERERGVEGHLSRSHVSKYVSQEDINEHEITCIPLYRHAQQPVVPEEMTIRDACKFVQDMRLFDDVSVIVMRTWNACRAALLQELQKSAGDSNNCRGSENMQVVQEKVRCGTKAAPTLDSSPKKAESRCGNSPVIPDGYVMVPKEPTKEMIDAGWLHYMGTKNPSSKGTYKAMLAAAPQEVK